jgi:glycosyltransferase involved in cell wall biosynthesis
MNKPTLALCIPAYNAAAYLPRLLTSAHKQAIAFDEILVYNDCSTDDTGQVAKAYGATVVEGDINRGCSFGKNKLAAITTCAWIHFHDADDALLPNFTELAHTWMNLEQAPDVVLFNYEWREHATNDLLHVRTFDRVQLERDPVAYSIREQINPFCGLYNRTKFIEAGGYDTDTLVLYNEDVALHCRLAIAGLSFSAESAVSIINYRIPNSMSASNQLKCIVAHFHVMRKVSQAVGSRYRREIANNLWGIAGTAAAHSDWATARASIALATKLDGRIPGKGGLDFKLLCLINPYLAVRLREKLIRKFKAHLR